MKIFITLIISLTLFACAEEHSEGDGHNHSADELSMISSAATDEKVEHLVKHLDPNYVCPMHPQIVRGEEGSCPICGMDLVAQEVGPIGEGAPVIRISAQTVQNMGIRTARVSSGRMYRFIDTLGSVSYDENKLHHIHSKVDGWIEKLKVRAEGDRIKKNQVILELYSPEIVAAQEEYLVALQNSNSKLFANSSQSLIAAAEKRLQLLDIPKKVIDKLKKTKKIVRRIPIIAPQSGVVTKLNVREGMFVSPGLQQFTIADTSSMWVIVEIFESQISWVEVGQDAEIRIQAVPNKVWKGKVEFIYPELNPMSRTLPVRLRFDNKDGLLKPNMLAKAVIYGGPTWADIRIPREALIRTGQRQSVIKVLEDGGFQPVDVEVLMQSGNHVKLKTDKGLKEGDKIVISGQFLLDSESNLQASFLRFQKAK